jgi:beta-N-acetylhexosaminidase
MLSRTLGAALGLLAVAVCSAAPVRATAVSDEPASESRVQVVAQTSTERDVRAAELVDAMTLRERAATVVMGHVPGTDVPRLQAYMSTTGIGGFLLMGANIPSGEAALRRLTAALTVDPALPPLIAVDQEGGTVSRLPWDAFAGGRSLAQQTPGDTTAAFRGRAALLQRAGISVNFGVVADVTGDRGSFIFPRSLGSSPSSAAARAAAAVAGEHGQVLSTLKHFPGHGAAPGDSHRGIPSTSLTLAQWQTRDAVPFAAGIAAGAELVMTGHLAYTAVHARPASLSTRWYDILRDDLGFHGVAITDDLGMLESSGVPAYRDAGRNAVAALAAGSDMVLTVVGSDAGTATRIVAAIERAVESGTLAPARLDEAARRVVSLRLQTASWGTGMLP